MSNQMSCEIEMIESQINNVVINYNNKVIEYESNLKMLGECNNNYTCYYNKYYECLENINSIKETFGVGILIATPSSLPFKEGIISPIAFEAPVEVGTID